MSRNYHIQFYRFLGSIIIMILHWNAAHKIGVFQGGYIICEFFFIISGFLMASKILSHSGFGEKSCESAAKEAWVYTKKKFFQLFPYSLTAAMGMFIAVSIIFGYQLNEVIKKFMDTFWEMSLLFMSGIGGTNYRYNGQAWFVSSLLIVGYFVYYFLKRHPHFYSRIFAPASVLLIYAFFWNKYTHICMAATFDTDISMELALIRTLAGLNLGVICYLVYSKYKSCNPTKLCKFILTATELFAVAFLILMIYKFSYTTYDYLLIVVLAVIVVLAFLNLGYGRRIFENKFVDFLGKLSMPLYFNHVFTYSVILRNAQTNAYLLYITITIALSVVEYILYEAIRKYVSKRCA